MYIPVISLPISVGRILPAAITLKCNHQLVTLLNFQLALGNLRTGSAFLLSLISSRTDLRRCATNVYWPESNQHSDNNSKTAYRSG